MTQTVWLVPHTHWDREWYEPFQRFRLRLVDLMDEVIALAEADRTFHFTLDGQLAVVDDYLEVRPEAASRIAALVASGQFAIGPWAILMDEFLCSGENIVRNLAWGLRRAADFGAAMPIGYLPDMFGHIAQMPQILALAGLRQACVWRGVPAAIDRHAFVWEAPDGTGVRTEYLPGGYGNAAELFAAPERLAEAAGEQLARSRPWFGDDPILAMYGTDHSAPLPGFVSAAAAVHMRVSTLADYLALFDPSSVDGLPVWRGELRSHARANILPGVISNRPHLKRGLGAAERMTERYAEPLAALWGPADSWPARLLDLAWERLVASACHDSVTGCGVDETAVQVAARIAEAEQIGRGVRDRALDAIAADIPSDAVAVVNPSPVPRTVVVRLDLPAAAGAGALALPDGSTVPVQLVGSGAGPLYETDRPAASLAAALRKGSLGLDFLGRTVQRTEVTGPRELTVTMGHAGTGLTMEDRALAPTVADTGGDWHLQVVEEPLRTAYASVPMPPLGWTAVRAVPAGVAATPAVGAGSAAAAPVAGAGSGAAAPVVGAGSGAAALVVGAGCAAAGGVTTRGRRLANDRLTVDVADDGSLTLSTVDGVVVAGVGRLVDGDDIGDLYNYAPPPDDAPAGVPDAVSVRVTETGPLVAALEVRRSYPWRARTDVVTRVELRAGEPFCRLDLSFTNHHPDHRVRLHVLLPRPAAESHAEGQFAVVARGLTAEGGHGEVPIPTFPAYSLVDAGGVALLLDQVSEYELVDGRELALTLLRATGLISRAEHPMRAEPAGPVIATPEAQLLGAEIRTRLAVFPHTGSWDEAVPEAEAYRCPPVTARGRAPAGGPLGQSTGLTVEGAVLSSLRRRDGTWLELRVVAQADRPTVARVGPVTAARRADLLGAPGEELAVVDGHVELPLRPWEIATVQFMPC